MDAWVLVGKVQQVLGEARAAEAQESGLLAVHVVAGTQQGPDVFEALEMVQTHGLVPFGFADGKEDLAPVGVAAERDQVDLVACLRDRIGDGAGFDAGPLAAQGVGGRVPAGPGAADLLEVRADDLTAKGGLRAFPYGGSLVGAFQVAPLRAHQGVVERQNRLRNAVGGALAVESIRLAHNHPGVFQNRQRMAQVGRLALQEAGNTPAGVVSLGNGREHAVIESGIAQVGFFREQEPRLAEQRAPRVEHVAQDPRTEVVHVGRCVPEHELAAIGRRAADHRIDEHGKARIPGQPPEVGSQAEVQGGHHKFETGAPAQRSGTRQQPSHKGQRGTAQQQPHRAAFVPCLWPERSLQQRGQFR